MALTLDPITGVIGATVDGVDLRQLTDDTVAAIRAAALEHLVLVFPDQGLTPEEQMAFAGRLGEIDTAPFGPQHPDHPEMTVLDQTSPVGEGADNWHSDNTFRAEPPSLTMLQAQRLPPVGGDTCWASMYAAYETLSPPLRRFLDPLTATHDLTRILQLSIDRGNSDADLDELRTVYPPRSHPVVRTHPETGRKGLFVNSNFTTRIDGLTAEESDRLLRLLIAHIRTPELQCRVTWSTGTLVVWDNRCTQHYAVPDYTSRRIMHRLILRGDEPR